MEITDITPARLRCGISACPALFRSDRGTLVIVGRRVQADIVGRLGDRIGPDEIAIEIPEGLLCELAGHHTGTPPA